MFFPNISTAQNSFSNQHELLISLLKEADQNPRKESQSFSTKFICHNDIQFIASFRFSLEKQNVLISVLKFKFVACEIKVLGDLFDLK
jgi:hypothetical protein